MKRFWMALFLGVCSFHDQSRAQDVSLQFVTFPKTSVPLAVQLQLSENKVLQLQVPSHELSNDVKVPQVPEWILGEEETTENGSIQFKVHGRARSLASQRQLVLLIRKGEKLSDGLDVIPLSTEAGKFAGGSFFFFNSSNVPIGGKLGQLKFAIGPKEHVLLDPEKGGAGLFHTVFAFQNGKEAVPFFSSTWPNNEKLKSLVFFYLDPTTKQLGFHSIQGL